MVLNWTRLEKDFLLLHPYSPHGGGQCPPSLKLRRTLPDGVIGNTSDSESEESRFDPWSGNKSFSRKWGAFFVRPGVEVYPDISSGTPGRATSNKV